MTEVVDVGFVASITGLGGIPVIVALVNIIKPLVSNTKWHPLIALFLGLVWNIGAYAGLTPDYTNIGWTQSAFQGLAVGLAASGAYEIVRSRQ